MTFKQWWDGIKWSLSMRLLVKPLAKPFAEMAWNAAVEAEREACAKICNSFQLFGEQWDRNKEKNT
jgi:hypothetical protein